MIRSNTIGSRIEKLRKLKKLTQKELADAMCVKRETVVHWESNSRDLKTEATIKLAVFFEVTCDYILRGVSAEQVDIYTTTGLTQDAINTLAASKKVIDSTVNLMKKTSWTPPNVLLHIDINKFVNDLLVSSELCNIATYYNEFLKTVYNLSRNIYSNEDLNTDLDLWDDLSEHDRQELTKKVSVSEQSKINIKFKQFIVTEEFLKFLESKRMNGVDKNAKKE